MKKSSSTSTYKACVMGASFQKGNLGVSALAASLIKIIMQICPDAEISFFVGNESPECWKLHLADRTVSVRVVNHRMSPKARLKEHILWILLVAFIQRFIPSGGVRKKIIDLHLSLSTIMGSSFVGDIRGGDSFSDIYGLRGFLIGSLPAIITLLLRKKLVLLPQTYGPYKSAVTRWVARWILTRSSVILARDLEGVDVVKGMLGRRGTGKRIEFCPDVAFMLDSLKSVSIEVRPPLVREPGTPIIGFNVSGLLYNGGFSRGNMFGLKFDYKAFAFELAQKLLKETDAHLLLVPHSFPPKGSVESDVEACAEIMRQISPSFEGRIHIVSKYCDQSVIKGIIGLCDFFIGSRMHACIAALSQGIPTVGVAYSRKFIGVFSSLGLESMIVDARSVPMDAAINRVMDSLASPPVDRVEIAKRVNEAQRSLLQTFMGILE